MKEKIIFEWKVPKDHRNFTGYDDIAEAYRIFESEEASGGCIIEAKYNKKWITNPWNIRPLVKHLIEQLGAEK